MEPAYREWPGGPWHCPTCLRHLRKGGVRDVTLDVPLMKYLVMKEVPSEKADKLRVKRASRFLRVDERGVLWAKHPETGMECYIPPICEREDLIK